MLKQLQPSLVCTLYNHSQICTTAVISYYVQQLTVAVHLKPLSILSLEAASLWQPHQPSRFVVRAEIPMLADCNI